MAEEGFSENVYKSIMRARVLGALREARASKGITHRGLKGRVREILISDLFRPLLPGDVSIASGQIVDCKNGRLSRQQDIVLFDGAILPPVSFDASAAIIPIEAVLYTIELKSTLTRSVLQAAHWSAKELRTDFGYLDGISIQNNNWVSHEVLRLNSVLFALESDIAGDIYSEPRRYAEIYGQEGPYLQALCVAGKGYWYESNGSWVALTRIMHQA